MFSFIERASALDQKKEDQEFTKARFFVLDTLVHT